MADLMTDKNDRLVILQTKAQASHYQHNRREVDDIVIPIGPEAMYFAEQNGWATRRLGDCWTGEASERARTESQARLDALIESLNDYSRRWSPTLGLEIGNYYAFQLWVIIGQIHYNYFIVHSIAENLKPTKLLCYTKSQPQAFMELRPDPDCIFAEVLRNSGLFKIEQFEIQCIDEKRKANTLREKIIAALPISVRAWLRGIRDRRLFSNSGSPAHDLLVIGGGGDWIRLNGYPAFNELFRLHNAPKLVAGGSVTPTSELIGILENAVQFDSSIPYDLKDLTVPIQTDLNLFAEKARDIISSMKKYDAVVTAVLTFPRDNFLAHMAAVAGRPVMVWQHGEMGQTGFNPLSLYTELFYATDYLAYAPMVQKQYGPWIGKYRLANVEAVGSIDKKINWRGGNNIVYATGKWFKTAVGFLPKSDPDGRLYDAHRTILDYLEGVASERPVVFKANNTPGLNTIPYQYHNIHIDYSTPFTALLETAGVVILDTPATTLVEACTTKVPIFVLGGRCEYTAEFLDVVKRRVVWCEKPEELVVQLSAYLSDGHYEADASDDTYLKQYCAHAGADKVIADVRNAVFNGIRRSNGTTSAIN